MRKLVFLPFEFILEKLILTQWENLTERKVVSQWSKIHWQTDLSDHKDDRGEMYNSKTFSTEFSSNSDINFLHSNHNIFSNNDQGPAKRPHEARVQFQETDAAFCKAQRTAGYVILLLD